MIPVSCPIEEVVLDHPREGLSHHGYFVKVKLKRLPQDIAFLKILPTSSPVHSHSHQKLFGHLSGPQSSPYPSQCRALGVSTTSDSDQSDYLPSLLKMRLGTSKSSDGRGHSLSEEAGHLKSHVRELGEARASLERSHDLETCLLKGNRTLQEQSVECEQPKEEYRWLREELNVTRATLPGVGKRKERWGEGVGEMGKRCLRAYLDDCRVLLHVGHSSNTECATCITPSLWPWNTLTWVHSTGRVGGACVGLGEEDNPTVGNKWLPQNIAFLKILPTSSPVHSHSHQKLIGHPSGPQSSPYPSQCRALGVSTTSDSDQSDYLPSLLKMRLGTSSWSKAGSCKVS
ncbi:hypothetical protein EMCRGX_G011552 [Ephydatia muelleri]